MDTIEVTDTDLKFQKNAHQDVMPLELILVNLEFVQQKPNIVYELPPIYDMLFSFGKFVLPSYLD